MLELQASRMTWRSPTLVPVGPGADEIAERVEERVGVVVVEVARRVAQAGAARARSSVVESTMAPAASVGPSMPSVPTLATTRRRRPARERRRPARARTPDCGRPCPCRCTRTVVSPLETTHSGPPARRRAAPAPRARCAARPSRASPTTGSSMHDDVVAAARAASAAAPAIASRRPPITRRGRARQPRVAGLRRLRHARRARPRRRCATTAGGIRARRRRSARARRARRAKRAGVARPSAPTPMTLEVVADDVGDRERHDTAAGARPPAGRP